MSIDRTLALLDSLTPLWLEKRQQRSLDLLGAPGLRPDKADRPDAWPVWCEGWAFAIQPTLAAALDIQLTTRIINKESTLEWTQGTAFDFREGYTIHDAPEAWTTPGVKPSNVVEERSRLLGRLLLDDAPSLSTMEDDDE